MSNYIIIRAGMNGGKTTTSGLIFEQLKKEASFFRIYNYGFKEIPELLYDEEGNLGDFIAVIIIGDTVIIIISRGDVASDLKQLLENLSNPELVKKLTNELSSTIHFYVCCARSVNRPNSSIQMLETRVPESNRREFWTVKSDDFKDRRSIKQKVVADIIQYIKSKM